VTKTERYNKVLFGLWVLFSAVTFAILVMLVLNSMAALLELDEMLVDEGVAMSFLLLFFVSEIVGAILASKTIDRVPWAYHFISV
jgi:hypothetical protein